MERRITLRLATVLILLLTCAPAAPSAAAILGFGDLGKANKAFDAGRLSEALPMYQQILADNDTWNEKRGEAAWHVTLIRLGGNEGLQDVDAGCKLAGELLRAYSQQPHEVELKGILRLCQTANKALKAVTDLQRRVSAAQQKADEQQRAAEKARSERDSARTRLEHTERQLDQARAALSRKDAILDGLTGALIGKPGGRRGP